jgi:BirA family biotin operon repressor/biotin-[acetyl-CoA-carboxylase] ligase
MRRVHFDVIDSTNTQARRLAAIHPGERLLISALEQTAGRGRLGRTWHSPAGGAWMSLVWPMNNAPSDYSAASLVSAIAVLRSIREFLPEAGDRLKIKWPNDVLIDGRKVAGILCEQFSGADSSTATLIVGVGVNVDFDPATLGVSLRHPATSLRAATARTIPVIDIIAAISGELVDLLTDYESEGFSSSLQAELRASLAYIGMTLRVDVGGRESTGRLVDIDASGRLVLEREGDHVAFEAGELIVHAPPLGTAQD